MSEYTLRKPIEADWNPNGDMWTSLIPASDGAISRDGHCLLDLDAFHEYFVSVVEAKTKLKEQIVKTLQSYGARFYADYEVDRVAYGENKQSDEVRGELEGAARLEFAEAILELVYGDKETEQ